MPKISVIVPVYKAEQYLKRCVDSILNQTFTDFELILVDDGSPDQSGTICNEYAFKDKRVKVIHKENGGVSSARQVGLDAAQGDYVIHADPDDWVEPQMLNDLYGKAMEDKADMVYCDFYYDYNNGKCEYVQQQINEEETLNADTLIKNILEGKIHGSCWNKLIRKKVIDESEARFPDRIVRWEDMWFNLLVLRHCNSISYLNRAYYHYDQTINKNSIVRVVRKEAVESQIRFCHYFSTLFSGNDAYAEGLYKCKARTKELMFYSSFYTPSEIDRTFGDINKKYIQEYKHFSYKHIESFLLSLLLSGHYKIAGCANLLYVKILLLIKNKIKYILWHL